MTTRRLAAVLATAAVLTLAAAPAAEARHWRRHHHTHHHDSGWGFGLGLVIGAVAAAAFEPDVYVVDRGPYVTTYHRPWPQPILGAINVRITPRSAGVWLDGQAVGTSDDFDGWPAKLHAEPGTHHLEFRAAGYRPLRVTVEVLPRKTVKIEYRLEPDPAYRAWRIEDGRDADDAPERPGIDPDRAPVADADTGSLRLEVEPPDASVYVDGRLKGGGEGGSRYALELPAGPHRIEVVKPGYDLFSAEIVVRERQRQSIEVRLTKKD